MFSTTLSDRKNREHNRSPVARVVNLCPKERMHRAIRAYFERALRDEAGNVKQIETVLVICEKGKVNIGDIAKAVYGDGLEFKKASDGQKWIVRIGDYAENLDGWGWQIYLDGGFGFLRRKGEVVWGTAETMYVDRDSTITFMYERALSELDITKANVIEGRKLAGVCFSFGIASTSRIKISQLQIARFEDEIPRHKISMEKGIILKGLAYSAHELTLQNEYLMKNKLHASIPDLPFHADDVVAWKFAEANKWKYEKSNTHYGIGSSFLHLLPMVDGCFGDIKKEREYMLLKDENGVEQKENVSRVILGSGDDYFQGEVTKRSGSVNAEFVKVAAKRFFTTTDCVGKKSSNTTGVKMKSEVKQHFKKEGERGVSNRNNSERSGLVRDYYNDTKMRHYELGKTKYKAKSLLKREGVGIRMGRGGHTLEFSCIQREEGSKKRNFEDTKIVGEAKNPFVGLSKKESAMKILREVGWVGKRNALDEFLSKRLRRRFAAVLLDMDGVIADSEDLHRRSFNYILKRFGLHISKNEWRKRYAGIGSPSIMREIFKKHRIDGDVDDWVRKRSEKFISMLNLHRLPSIPGVKDFLRWVKVNGLKVMVVSGSHGKSVEKMLENMNIGGMNIIGRDKVSHSKPSPECYLLAAKKLGVEPADCIVFEDSVAGVIAARRAGAICIGLLTTCGRRRLEAAGADFIIKDFRDRRLAKIFRLLFMLGRTNQHIDVG
ncbi:MAG: HAD family phosphatase [Candidatus Anstonellales archaeon]